MTPREERGLIIAATCKLNRTDDGTFLVPNQSNVDKIYRVNMQAKSCTCPDHAESGFTCKHFHAASYTFQRDYLPDGTMIETRNITLTQKTVFKQDWRAYNLAQSTEKHRFQELLFDLTRGVKETYVPGGRGRTPHSNKDSIFAMAYKVYSTFSSRRFSCDLKDAHEKNYLSRTMPGLKVPILMENPSFTPILKELIGYSARPLRGVESDFAIDSSGFSLNKFEKWFDHKHGTTRFKHAWVKVHLACGVKTNVVTAVGILAKRLAAAPHIC